MRNCLFLGGSAIIEICSLIPLKRYLVRSGSQQPKDEFLLSSQRSAGTGMSVRSFSAFPKRCINSSDVKPALQIMCKNSYSCTSQVKLRQKYKRTLENIPENIRTCKMLINTVYILRFDVLITILWESLCQTKIKISVKLVNIF